MDPRRFEAERAKRELQWNAKLDELRGVTDGLGLGLDEPIVETVAALQLNGFSTRQSCGGHLDWGRGVPWVDLKDSGGPGKLFPELKDSLFFESRFEEQEEVFRQVAQEAGLEIETLMSRHNFDTYESLTEVAFQRACEKGETEEFLAHRRANERMRSAFSRLVDEYHQQQQVPRERGVSIASALGDGSFRIHTGTSEELNRDVRSMTESDRATLQEKLVESRADMQAFAQFLKQRFLSRGPAYSR